MPTWLIVTLAVSYAVTWLVSIGFADQRWPSAPLQNIACVFGLWPIMALVLFGSWLARKMEK